jgi:hypothetical protein
VLWALAIAAGFGAAVAVVVTAITFVAAVPGAPYLLIAAVPVLITGQIYTYRAIRARRAEERRATVPVSMQGRVRPLRDPRRLFFGDLRRDVATTLIVLAGLGLVAVLTAYPVVSKGGPDGSGPGCPYRLRTRTETVCVSAAEYDQVRAGQQRVIAGILVAFFSVHMGVALSGVLRRDGLGRRPDDEPGDPAAPVHREGDG